MGQQRNPTRVIVPRPNVRSKQVAVLDDTITICGDVLEIATALSRHCPESPDDNPQATHTRTGNKTRVRQTPLQMD